MKLSCPKHKIPLGRLYLNANFAIAKKAKWETDLWYCIKCEIAYSIKTVVDKPQTLTIVNKIKVKKN